MKNFIICDLAGPAVQISKTSKLFFFTRFAQTMEVLEFET